MSDLAVKRSVVVANVAGMHARAALMVVMEARKFKARVTISNGSQEVEATDMLQVLSLGAPQGEQLSLTGSGDDAQAAIDALEQLFLRKFDEE